ncbi:MAG: D-alanyl-D-alanine carboxypeptidase [Saprospiraceae bacterium]|nr:D-alanyl-D-alanine carboxypeptidase [Saprospiraceae bacterium]
MKYSTLCILFLIPLFAATQSRSAQHQLAEMIESSPVFSHIFSGFVLFDPETGDTLYQHDGHKYFTPASNTKIFTFYTSLNVLGDSLPALRYVCRNDTLIFWGTGNPLFLHPEMPHDSSLTAFLRDRPEKLFFSPHNYPEERYGPGWSWRDYEYAYQVEKSPLPIYGNVVRFTRDSLQLGFEVHPPRFYRHLMFRPMTEGERPYVRRQEHANTFEYNPLVFTGLPFEQWVPFQTRPALVAKLLSDTLKREVNLLSVDGFNAHPIHTLSLPLPDTLYRRLMQDSDNFIAEQLLLLCSDKLFGLQDTRKTISYAIDSLFQDAPDPLNWRDGSGLSRYNLFTPRTVVHLLHELYRQLDRDRLLNIFPAGGVSGTIEEWYGGEEEPYVFAKTGTLSNKHCLSGYLITDSDRTLIFSFMHNNYTGSSRPVKEEMEKVLDMIRQRY